MRLRRTANTAGPYLTSLHRACVSSKQGDVKSVARALDAYNASKTEGLTSGKV